MVLDVICGQLSYEDVLALRCTCKGLKQFIDGKIFTRLNLFVRDSPFHHQLFFLADESVGYPESLHSDDLAILSSARFREQFTNVQRMIICTKTWGEPRKSDTTGFDLGRLNSFRAINHLEVEGFVSISGKLSLQELRIAAFQVCVLGGQPELPIELDCPRLIALRVRDCWPALTGDQLEYLHLATPTHLFADNETADFLQSISPNLRKLSTIRFESAEKTMQFFSMLRAGLCLPSLKTVQLDQYPKDNTTKPMSELIDRLEDLQRDQMKHVQFIFQGVIRSPNQLRKGINCFNAFLGSLFPSM